MLFRSPCRGFGKVWRENPTVQQALGYALETERGMASTSQAFENGFIFFDAERNRDWMVNLVTLYARYVDR